MNSANAFSGFIPRVLFNLSFHNHQVFFLQPRVPFLCAVLSSRGYPWSFCGSFCSACNLCFQLPLQFHPYLTCAEPQKKKTGRCDTQPKKGKKTGGTSQNGEVGRKKRRTEDLDSDSSSNSSNCFEVKSKVQWNTVYGHPIPDEYYAIPFAARCVKASSDINQKCIRYCR